jgi:hypothetical protein
MLCNIEPNNERLNMRFTICIFAIVSGMFLSACPSPSRLEGPYGLVENGCDSTAIHKSHLQLKSDGTYDQHHELKNGQVIDVMGQRWRFHSGAVELEGFRLDGTGEHKATTVRVKADPRRPPYIKLPNSNCYYTGPK